jgi:ribosomal protein L11 methyltransferase
MHFLHLTCTPADIDYLSGELWETGTAGIRELEESDGMIRLIAAFETEAKRNALQQRFERFSPHWTHEPDADWIEATRNAWPGRAIGKRLFLAAPWCEEPTPEGRERVIHNPGLACGTGEHPCTQLALEALERLVKPGMSVADIGTGSGLLAIAALRLGAATALGVDPDEAALSTARQNFSLNGLESRLIAGSADCLGSESAHIVVANISATVLFAIADDLLRVARPDGALILTGFQTDEAKVVREVFPSNEVWERDGWSCLISLLSGDV